MSYREKCFLFLLCFDPRKNGKGFVVVMSVVGSNQVGRQVCEAMSSAQLYECMYVCMYEWERGRVGAY